MIITNSNPISNQWLNDTKFEIHNYYLISITITVFINKMINNICNMFCTFNKSRQCYIRSIRTMIAITGIEN